MIGAEKTADNFQKTIDMFGGAVPFDRGERIDMLDELSENEDFDGFEEIDDCYYENKVELDGKEYAFPASATELKKVLGEPRVVDIEFAASIRKGIAEDYGFTEENFHPVRYYWDEYGIVASAYDQENIGDIVIFFGKSQFPLKTLWCIHQFMVTNLRRRI